MALLNYASTYAEISGKITSTTGDDPLKIFISGDGHFITHNADILRDFNISNDGVRGLVPTFTGAASDKSKSVLSGNGWKTISVDMLPVDNSKTLLQIIQDASLDEKTYIPNVYLVNELLNKMLATTDVMRFKGVMSADLTKIYGNGSEITSCEIGDTYRFDTSGGNNKIGTVTCEDGDMIICIKDGTGTASQLKSVEYWAVIQTNINGEVTHNVNGSSYRTYSSTSSTFTIYAPTSAGTLGHILVSKGTGAPDWKDPNSIYVSGATKLVTDINGTAGVSAGNNSTPIYFLDGIPTPCTAPLGKIYKLEVSKNNTTTQADGLNPYINFIDITTTTPSVQNSVWLKGTGKTTISNTGNTITVNSTWRDIQIAGTSIADKALNIIPGLTVCLNQEIDGDANTVDLKFDLFWFNITSGNYEYLT